MAAPSLTPLQRRQLKEAEAAPSLTPLQRRQQQTEAAEATPAAQRNRTSASHGAQPATAPDSSCSTERNHLSAPEAARDVLEKLQGLKQQGNQCYQEGHLDRAVRLFTQAIQIGLTLDSPEASQALSALYSNRSLVFCLLGRATGSAVAVDPRATSETESLPPSELQGDNYFIRAAQDATEATKLAPEWQRALLRLGDAQLGSREYQEAIESFLMARGLDSANSELVDSRIRWAEMMVQLSEAPRQCSNGLLPWPFDSNGVSGKQLSGERLAELIMAYPANLSTELMGVNAMERDLIPALHQLQLAGVEWCSLCNIPGRFIYEFPTQELCIGVVQRILAAARAAAENPRFNQLIMVGIGSGTALIEAMITLHLSAILNQPVDLNAKEIQFILPGIHRASPFKIEIRATETPDLEMQALAHVNGQGCSQMHVEYVDRRDAVRNAARTGAAVFVYWSWMPTAQHWTDDIIADAGDRLVEILMSSMPPSCVQIDPREVSPREGLCGAELYPRSLCRYDYVDELHKEQHGLYHSKLYSLYKQGMEAPTISEGLVHEMGCYLSRLDRDENGQLQLVMRLREAGLCHVHNIQDLSHNVPDLVFQRVKMYAEQVQGTAIHGSSMADAFRRTLTDAMPFCSGSARAQLLELCELCQSK